MIRIHRVLMTALRERQHPLSMYIALTLLWACGPLAVSPFWGIEQDCSVGDRIAAVEAS